jgi:hypothetical protein
VENERDALNDEIDALRTSLKNLAHACDGDEEEEAA